MDIGKYKKAMRPKKYLDGDFVVYDPSLPDASDVQLETRDTFAIGGGVIEGEDYGTREGFVRPKVSSQKMTVNQALQEIFQTQTEFLNRDELKTLVDKKTGLNISKNVLKPSKYPILKKVKYRTSELMKEKTKQNKASGLSKEQRFEKAQTKKQQKINLFKEKLGLDIEIGSNNKLLGLDEDLKKKLNNASKSFRDKKLSTKGLETFNDPNFFDFFNTEYQTADDRIEAIAKSYGYNLDEWNTLSTEQKKRIYNEEFNNKMRIKRGEVPSGLSIEEIVEQAYQGKKLPGGGPAAKTLDTVYETLFRQEYDKLAEGGDPFSRADLSRNVEARLREMFGRPGQEFPEKLLPGRTPYTDASAKNYFQYIDPRTQGGSKKNKIFSDYELELFDGMTAASLNKTKTQEKLFDIIAKGPVEIDELSQKLDMTPNRIRSEINKLLTNAIIRTDKPAFLKDRGNDISSLINNLEASETLDNDWNRSLKYSIYSEINDPVLQKAAFNRIDEFDSMLKIIQEKFPGVQVQYDHPAGYTALKNQNFKNFLNVTPIAADINRLKSTFDSKSNQNLLAMNDAKAAGNQQLYNDLLNKQIKLENTWSKLTGGSSSLGKIRLEEVEDFGTTSLTDSSKDLFGEFKNNILIRENIAKNLSDDIKKDIIDVLPRKDRETSVIKTLESITNPDLIKQDKAVSQFVKKLEQKLQENPGMVESLKKGGFRCRGKIGGKIDLECLVNDVLKEQDKLKTGTDLQKKSAANKFKNAAKNISKTAGKARAGTLAALGGPIGLAIEGGIEGLLVGWDMLINDKPFKEAWADNTIFLGGMFSSKSGEDMRQEIIVGDDPLAQEYYNAKQKLDQYDKLQKNYQNSIGTDFEEQQYIKFKNYEESIKDEIPELIEVLKPGTEQQQAYMKSELEFRKKRAGAKYDKALGMSEDDPLSEGDPYATEQAKQRELSEVEEEVRGQYGKTFEDFKKEMGPLIYDQISKYYGREIKPGMYVEYDKDIDDVLLKQYEKDLPFFKENINTEEQFPFYAAYAGGGRVGFKDGGSGITRRGFLKVIGALASSIAAAKSGFVKFAGKEAAKEVVTTPNIPGKPEWFDAVVNKVIKEGADLTKQFATKEREIIHVQKLGEQEGARVIRDLDTGEIRLEYESPTNMGEEPVTFTYKPAEQLEEGKTVPAKFEANEAEPRVVNWDGDIEFDDEFVTENIDELMSDTSTLKQYGTGKLDEKDLKIRQIKTQKVQKINSDTSETLEYLESSDRGVMSGRSVQDYLYEAKRVGDIKDTGEPLMNPNVIIKGKPKK